MMRKDGEQTNIRKAYQEKKKKKTKRKPTEQLNSTIENEWERDKNHDKNISPKKFFTLEHKRLKHTNIRS